jgi:hypothetical protein
MAAPPEHSSRSYRAFVRGPAGINTYAFGTVDEYRDGVQHIGLLADFPTPSDNAPDDFGILSGGSFTVELADQEAGDENVLDEDGAPILDEDGTNIIEEYI